MCPQGHLPGVEQAGHINDVVEDAPTDRRIQLNSAARKGNSFGSPWLGSYASGVFSFAHKTDSFVHTAEIASIEDINKAIKQRIQSLNPESNRDLSEIKSNLKQLHDILRLPILDRVLELSGLGRSMSALGRHARSVVRTGSQGNPVSWLDKGRSWMDILCSYLKDMGFPIKTLPVGGDELPQDILDVIKKTIIQERIKRWNYLQKVLLEFQAEDNRYTSPNFKLRYLESVYLLGELIYRHNLLPPDSIKEIEIFKPTSLFKMIEYHVELLFSRGKEYFFDMSDSVIPELEFLTTGNAVKHFHRPIKDLSARDQKHAVYLVLKIILRHAPWFSSGRNGWGISPWFEDIRVRFTRDGFLEDADRLSLAISNNPRNVDFSDDGNTRTIILVDHVLLYLDDCPEAMNKMNNRVAFQVVFYISNFLREYYHPIVQAVDNRTGISTYAQFDFLRGYLKFFRNRFEDPSSLQKPVDLTSLRMRLDPSHITKYFIEWTDIVTAREFGHLDVFVRPKSRPPNFSPWMGQ
ncbi:hypothetical protein PSTG_14296 [Puccinia striiformis f. sp. tritici PST-78]|uniref:Uncharacterized protein n=1 Tax=Puccinia striiformis f. sp. tritici PST-78 TaxID=1165861 RepID=A0A0L0UZ63_9BASI|nr:hypothetical protein PSTG_14296 [Puccinia striiformis f. sp. tritici PST-78]